MTAPAPADPRPDRHVLWGRVRLALAILSHRPWCPACARHARQVEQALNGESIETLSTDLGVEWRASGR